MIKKPLDFAGARELEPIPEDIDLLQKYRKKFRKLVEKAQADGVDVVVLTHYWDKFSQETDFLIDYSDTSKFILRGMLKTAKDIMGDGAVYVYEGGDEDEENAKL